MMHLLTNHVKRLNSATFRSALFISLTMLASCGITLAVHEFPIRVDPSDGESAGYSKVLTATGEPTIPTRMFDSISFFVRLTSLQDARAPVVIWARCNVQCRFRSKRLLVEGDFESVSIAESHLVELNSQRASELVSMARNAVKYRGRQSKNSRLISASDPVGEAGMRLDGARWIMEIVDEKGYWLYSKRGNNTSRDRAHKVLCDFLIIRSRLGISEDEFC